MYCSGCGTPLGAPESFCSACGHPLFGGEASAKRSAIRPPNTGHCRLTRVLALVVLGVAVVVAVVIRAFATGSTSSPAVTYYKTITELRAMRGNAIDTSLRVGGDVQRGSVQRNRQKVRFVLEEGALQMQVVYEGADPFPETFRESAAVLVGGRLGRDDVFHASEVSVVNVEPWLPPKPETFIAADDLFDEYQQNEVRADQLYRGHYIEVYGQVRRVGKDILDNAYVSFRVSGPVLGVRCGFSSPTPAWVGEIGPGARISLVCKGTGKSVDVVLGDCRAGSVGFTSNTSPEKQP
ncbi:MAG: cytochrome c maturation protein CcmE [Bryobacteraceae bacterium]